MKHNQWLLETTADITLIFLSLALRAAESAACPDGMVNPCFLLFPVFHFLALYPYKCIYICIFCTSVFLLKKISVRHRRCIFIGSLLIVYVFVELSRDSSVDIATHYGLDGPGIESRWGGEIFRTSPDRPWGPPSLLYNGYRGSFPGVKRPGHGVDHPPPSSAEVKERVQLYLYSASWPSWPVLGWPLPLPIFCTSSSSSAIYSLHMPHLL
jgi:hypothetical protein